MVEWLSEQSFGIVPFCGSTSGSLGVTVISGSTDVVFDAVLGFVI